MLHSIAKDQATLSQNQVQVRLSFSAYFCRVIDTNNKNCLFVSCFVLHKYVYMQDVQKNGENTLT